MAEQHRPDPAESAPPLLRPHDQAAIAGMMLVALVSLAVYWIAQGGLSGRLIEHHQAQRGSVALQIDINHATWPELTLLPQIGETLARRIVETREEHGPFHSHDDLRNVRGIGPKTLEKLRPYLAPIDEDLLGKATSQIAQE